MDHYYLTGTLDSGPTEHISSLPLEPMPIDQKSLNRIAPIGEKFDVFYNPNESNVFLNGHYARVLSLKSYSTGQLSDVVFLGSITGGAFAIFLFFAYLGIRRIKREAEEGS